MSYQCALRVFAGIYSSMQRAPDYWVEMKPSDIFCGKESYVVSELATLEFL
jgi:hypothetical protein